MCIYMCLYVQHLRLQLCDRDAANLWRLSSLKLAILFNCNLLLLAKQQFPPARLPPRGWYYWPNGLADEFEVGGVVNCAGDLRCRVSIHAMWMDSLETSRVEPAKRTLIKCIYSLRVRVRVRGKGRRRAIWWSKGRYEAIRKCIR